MLQSKHINQKESKMKSAIINNGPSLLDGKPIVVVATYSNRNKKTILLFCSKVKKRSKNTFL